jgi:1-acyl-sn-glycerol-3-phosphate acyltransferase
MSSVINRAQPALDFIPPNYSGWLRRVMKPLMPMWTALQTDVAQVEARNVEALANLYRDFEAGNTRFLLAFRHPNQNDPYVLGHLLWHELPKVAGRMGLSLGATHSHFIYDRGIPLWAGSYLSWVFSHLGGVPIQRGKLDLMALKTARRLFVDGRFPMAAAPEGGNNGHNEIVSPLEPGISQLAFWCAEDLKAAGRTESVVILPVGIQYRYLNPPWAKMDAVMTQMEADSGLGQPTLVELAQWHQLFATAGVDVAKGESPKKQAERYGRLYRLAEHMLTLMEGYYRDFYGMKFESGSETAADGEGALGELARNDRLAERLRSLMDKALQVAEQYFDVRPKGSVIDRCRKIEQAGWDRIFREDTTGLSPVELGLANRVAEESNLRMWHMRLVESFVAVTGCYVKERPSADRFAETLLLLRDMVAKLKGEVPRHDQFGRQKAIVTVGRPLVVSDRLADYEKTRRGAIASLTQDLQTEMTSLILHD